MLRVNKKKSIITAIMLMGLMLTFYNCHTNKKSIVIPAKPYEKLSEYNFFTGEIGNLQPNEGVLPYDLNSPLFSDYAQKARFVWIPDGQSATFAEKGEVLDFPKQTVLIKNFYYENDEREPSLGRNIIETRLLINRGEEWEAISYIWNKEQDDAFLEVIGDIKEVSWVNAKGETQSINYLIPNKNQCKTCHLKGKKQVPIGPKVRNLNKTFAYTEGEMNQLEKWTSIGYLKGMDMSLSHPSVAVWNDDKSGTLHDRAMAYLDINCAHCHNPEGSAKTSGLHLDANANLDMSVGIYKATVSAGAGTGGHTYSIVPGKPDESVMVYRMNSTNPGAMMPEIGRSMVHTEGVNLIRKWIQNMEVEKDKIISAKLN